MDSPLLFSSLPALFSLTLFLSAGLLFFVELMIAKMILPLLGGTPAVWNTCMMFFQAVLLAGYGYAHISGAKMNLSRQIVIHLAILVAACIVLPIAVPRWLAPPAEANPLGYVLFLLLISVGPPFFVLSGTAPLLQKWFAQTGHRSAADPYFLYSASNLGSMLALLGYPALIEPRFRLVEQSLSWTRGYIILAALTVLCAALTRKYATACPSPFSQGTAERCVLPVRVNWMERGRWILFAFVPSSLMLGVTTFLSTDVAAVPLFWVVPLSLYLLSFIIVFARVPDMVRQTAVFLLPLSLAALIFVDFSDIGLPKSTVFLFHLVNFFVFCMVCHGEIARTRPATAHLTEYYLWLSVGGALGGIFNSLAAPVIFKTILEYPVVLAVGAILLPVKARRETGGRLAWKEAALYVGVPVATILLAYWATVEQPDLGLAIYRLHDYIPIPVKTLESLLTYGLLVLPVLGLIFLKRPFLFGIGIAALLLTLIVSKDFTQDIVHRQRSFFGVLTVTRALDGTFISLTHGTTLHGKQWLNEFNRHEPVSYYHRTGPAGRVFSEFNGRKKKARIAVAGLGTGSLAAYAGAGQEIDFYEIDPAVKRIAADPAYFTFLSDCPAGWRVILGDARLTLAKAPPRHYGLIVVDAFSSDSIPVHLLTKEAVELYFSKLSEDGALLLHITNRYLNLAPVLARLADENGFADRICDDDGDYETGKDGSTWVLLARDERYFGGLAGDEVWKKIDPRKTAAVWTDDFSNILSVFKW